MTDRVKALGASLFFLALAPGTVAGWIPRWITGWQRQPPWLGSEAVAWLGWPLIAAGLAVLLDSFLRFALQGIGTPAPVYPTRHLVIGGLYRLVRNPMYVAILSVLVGQTLWFAHPLLAGYTALVAAGFHLFVVFYEEPVLRRTHGEAYGRYCRQVPRWIPAIRGAGRP